MGVFFIFLLLLRYHGGRAGVRQKHAVEMAADEHDGGAV